MVLGPRRQQAAILKALLIWKRSDGTPVDQSNNASLFESFARPNDGALCLSAASLWE
jgi:hypothetical protein